MRLPKAGITREELLELMREARTGDANWREGRTAALVYYAGEEILGVTQEAYLTFFSENGLGQKAFPSLRLFETEVVSMTASMLHGEQAVGNVTSGGTESLLLAVKTARDRARALWPSITEPEMVLPVTAHPAFNKAAHYFGVKAIRTPMTATFRADVAAMRAAVTDNTVLIVGSAPSFSHGVIDPIPDIALLAEQRGIPCHVDACMGGFFLPFLEKLGCRLPPFDFRVPGVTSISADVHKYGFGAKGASTILYRNADLHKHQVFEFAGWPRGLYSSPTIAGTRPGGAIAAAWAIMRFLGEDGYLRVVEKTMAVTKALIGGINRIPGLEVWGQPDMSLFPYGSRTLDVYAVADGLAERGWYVSRLVEPPSIHLVVTPAHEVAVGPYLRDVAEVADRVRRGEIRSRGTAVRYS